MAWVLADEMKLFRYTFAVTSPMAAAPSTGPIRATISGAILGNVTVSPLKD